MQEDGITPSAQLLGFKDMSLESQGGPTQQERPPVPLFAEAGPPAATQRQHPRGSQLLGDAGFGLSQQPSQQGFLSTPDFITPVDQFQLEYDPGNKEARHQRSPAQLSPNRIKRPRKAGEDGGMEEGADSQGQPRGLGGSSLGAPSRTTAAGNPYGPPAGRRLVARAASPPCLRNMFSGAEGDGQLVGGGAAVAPAPASAPGSGGLGLSRFRADFKEAGILGQGAFSKVFRARHRLDGQEYAVKRSIAEVVPGSLAVRQWVQEVQALAAVPPHPHLVQYYSAWREPGDKGGEHLYIQLERCDATLADHAGLGGELREADLLDLLAQTTAALAHLHAHGIAHLDVKPDNIYIRYGEDDAPAFKLGDFGQAAAADGRGPAVVSEGDSRYLPHEVLNSDYRRLDKADMFSLGVTLYELASGAMGSMPSGGPLYHNLRAGKLGLMPSTTMPLQNMIRSLLSPDPAARPSAEKVLASSLLARRQQQRQQQQQQRHAASEGVRAAQPQQAGAAAAPLQGIPAPGGGPRRLGGLVLQRVGA